MRTFRSLAVYNMPAHTSRQTQVPESLETDAARASTLVEEALLLTSSPTIDDSPPLSLPRHPKRLILCFDGTCNLFDATNTNVVRLVSYLRKDDVERQQVYYQTGVGTYIKPGWMMPFAVKVAKMFDMAVAWDISNHIMGGYAFLMQNYVPGDKISIFGFSRGAYTARALAGMLHKVGLLTRANEEQVPFAFSMYQTENAQGWDMSDAFKHTFCNEVQVDFLGVWDTVASVGLFKSKDLPFTASDHHIRVFRHAISVDERRCKFKANQWQEPFSPPNSNAPGGGEPGTLHPHLHGSPGRERQRSQSPCPRNTLPAGQSRAASVDLGGGRWSTDVGEVWFAGGHGDVGGGCAKNTAPASAARIPLTWMIREIVLSNTGIEFNTVALESDGISLPSPATGPAVVTTSKDGMLNTRRGLAKENWVENLDKRYELDVKAEVSDQLRLARSWWMLEVMPFTYRVPVRKEGPDNWKLSPRPNLGRARAVQGKKVQMHCSVKKRMENGGYQPKANCPAEIEWVH
ncbi:hypothetical protein CALVIDRAFT_206627 [Calocera viscosa TUFC12733]|uniref:T6SS Phospholipase effector Tle1-like catalytic domain-containing protein n=1 Tax=Calocera viscosa (strain TUFC12733) TaxID=1330018 RepID=A0A167KF58_CALVF|nr:hypothetical protein CALVIDRAFT_206627 [Calocera viscosa TUFC12733]